jgi:protein SCO1
MALLLTCWASPVQAAPPRQGQPRPMPEARERLKGLIPDVSLIDQQSRSVHFYRDLVRGKTAVINFIFTRCERLCPAQGSLFAQLRKRLGEQVTLISVSLDPALDTPERLKAWQEKFGAGSGWTLVTGPREQIDRLVMALTGDIARPEGHTPIVIIGNDSSGAWVRANGLSGVDALSVDGSEDPTKNDGRVGRGRRGGYTPEPPWRRFGLLRCPSQAAPAL